MSGEQLHQMGVVALAKALSDRKVSAVEASQACLGRLKACRWQSRTCSAPRAC